MVVVINSGIVGCDFSKFCSRLLMEMGLKDLTSRVRESVSVDSLATGTVLRETSSDPALATADSAQAQQTDGKPPENRLYFFNSVEFLHFITLLNISWLHWEACCVFSLYALHPLQPNLQVCNPAYLVPLQNHDKLGGLQPEGHPA